MLSLALCLVVGYNPELRRYFELGERSYGSFTAVLGLLVVFRVSQAGDHFWGSCDLLHGMMGDWFDAASTVVSFCRMSTADPSEVQRSVQLLIRLMSLLNAMILGESHDVTERRAHHFELLDVQGIDIESIRSLPGPRWCSSGCRDTL